MNCINILVVASTKGRRMKNQDPRESYKRLRVGIIANIDLNLDGGGDRSEFEPHKNTGGGGSGGDRRKQRTNRPMRMAEVSLGRYFSLWPLLEQAM